MDSSRDELPLASIRHRNNPGVGRNLPADRQQFIHGSLEISAIAFSRYSLFHGNTDLISAGTMWVIRAPRLKKKGH